MATATTAAKANTIMVYPANGALGFMMCKEMMEGDKKSEIKDVLAVCCTKDSKYFEKLKEMKCKTIVLDDATSMESWKKNLKDYRCDGMLLCIDPSATRHQGKGKAMEDQIKEFGQSLECAIEMTAQMNCKSSCCVSAMNSFDSKYQSWFYLYSVAEKAYEKHFGGKGKCPVIFYNMMAEILFLNRKQIMDEKKMSWPISPNAQSCPLSARDCATCCIAMLFQMMHTMMKQGADTDGPVTKETQYHITGPDMMTVQMMTDMMGQSLTMPIQYQQVQSEEWKKMMENRLSAMEIACILEAFQMMDDGKLKQLTDDFKKITEKDPEHFDQWMKRHENKFKMEKGK